MRPSAPKVNRIRATAVWFSDEMMHVRLGDERIISVPIAWFPRLKSASSEQRERWRMIGGGVGIRWPDLDEDVPVATLLK